MNFKKMIFASAWLLAMTACSEDEVMGNQGDEAAQAYMSLSIEMPNVGGLHRAINENGNTNAGTVGEQTISNLLVLVYDENGQQAQAVTVAGDKLVPSAPNPVQPANTTTYTLPAFKVESAGKKQIVVVVNPLTDKFGENAKANVNFMHEALQLTQDEVKQISSTGKFLMTNVNRSATANGAVEVNVTADNNKNNPAVISVAVERVVAKIEDQTKNYEFEVKNSQGDKVTFTNVALVNGNTKFFPIMRVRENKQGSDNDYVVDPNFEGQNEATAADFFANAFTTFPVTDGTWVKNLDTKAPACFYTLENTMTAAEQMNAYTTGLYYKAVYHLHGANKGDNIYQYGGTLYTWEQFAQQAAANGLDLNGLTNDSTQEDFDKINVKKYVGGVCYYPYWIRHVGTSDTEMTPMEFAVVRNNYYQVTINTVKGIGDYKPVNPDPSTPDEVVESFLNVTVKVMPWIVRDNKIDF